MLKFSLFIFIILCSTSLVLSLTEEDCEEPEDVCNGKTEYNSYLDCLREHKRQKREIGCPLAAAANCEYVDCSECTGCYQDDSCSIPCKRCCTESCNDQLCCHKTCNNQCKTNYCRTGCRRECKEKILYQGGGGGGEQNIVSNSEVKTSSKHNITTIINLHNIINNTNQIDIPIRINNTNFNNITLELQEESNVDVGVSQQRQVDRQGNRCCQVIGPRICNKLQVFPFLSCYHYRKHRCGPFCNAPIVHAQPQQICEENSCHNRMIYIPQPQPSCYHTPYWPFVNCGGGGGGGGGGGQMANCHGCYKHYTKRSINPSNGGCSRCYDDGFSNGPYYRQGPFYRPGFAHMPSCLQMGSCGFDAFGGFGMPYGGFGFGMGYGMGGYGFDGYQGSMGGYPMGGSLGYPLGSYFGDIEDGRNITVTNDTDDDFMNDDLNPTIEFNSSPTNRNTRYASIVIDGPKKHNEKIEPKEEKSTIKVKKEIKEKDQKPVKEEAKSTMKNDDATTVVTEKAVPEKTTHEKAAHQKVAHEKNAHQKIAHEKSAHEKAASKKA